MMIEKTNIVQKALKLLTILIVGKLHAVPAEYGEISTGGQTTASAALAPDEAH